MVVDRMARDFPDHDALITANRSFTYAQLREEVRRTAASMLGLGVSRGDRVAIWAPNTWHWIIACLATHYAGGVLVPLNTRYTAAEASGILARTAAPLLIAMSDIPGADRLAELDRAALPALRHIVRIPADGDADRDDSWKEFLSGPHAPFSDVDARAAAVRPDDVADILFTSGTTGRSKGVLCSHRQSLSASAAAAACRGITRSDRFLCIPPFFHTFGYRSAFLACLQAGATLVPQQTFNPEQAMAIIAEQRITVLLGPPTIYQVLLDHPARRDYDLGSLRVALISTTTVPVSLIERISVDLGIDSVLTCYGLTESTGYATTCRPGDDAVTIATTCGRPIAGVELRIDNADHTGVGEVLVRGPYVMLGYLDDPAATASAIDSDGWLHTGDVGRLDAGGNLRITDRLKDMYVCGGFNVYPAEVEQVVAHLPAVAEVAIVGVPHPVLGEVGRAFIVVRPGAELDRQDVISCIRDRLADFKVPRSVVFVGELPRNAGGKVIKSVLRGNDYAAAVQIAAQADEVATPGLGGPPTGLVEGWVANTWQVLLNIDRPGRLDRFTDLGGDSLSAIEFSEMMHTQFGMSMSVDWLAARPTIAAIVADLEAGGGEQRQPVVRLRTDGEGPVCLMVPGVGGHAWVFYGLAEALTGPCDVLALSLMDLRSGPADQIRDRIRSAALTALRPEVASGRPIVVAGYSFGGLIAADLVPWLTGHGVPVARLYLLDPVPLDSSKPGWVDETRRRWRRRWRRWSAHPWTFIDDVKERWRAATVRDSPVGRSSAARQLELDMDEGFRILKATYLDGSVRMPTSPVSWVRTREMATRYHSASTVFGTPITQIESAVLETDHFGLHRVSGSRQLADWWDQQPVGNDAC
jgi:acyl-CoA synthetase (AMP-forming)/AMP-acid ligase II/thioesterase domain-containing protein